MFAGGQKSRAVFAELSLRAPDVLILVSHLAGWDVVMSARMISEVRCIHFFFLFLGGGRGGCCSTAASHFSDHVRTRSLLVTKFV